MRALESAVLFKQPANEQSPFSKELLAILDDTKKLARVDLCSEIEPNQTAVAAMSKDPLDTPRKLLRSADSDWTLALRGGLSPKDALLAVGPQFDQALKAADIAYQSALRSTQIAVAAATADIKSYDKSIAPAVEKVTNLVDQLPRAGRDKLDDYLNYDRRLDLKKQVGEKLAKQPGLRAIADVLEDSSARVDELANEPVTDPRVQKAATAMLEAYAPADALIGRLPRADRESIWHDLNQYIRLHVSEQKKQELVNELNQASPALLPAISELRNFASPASIDSQIGIAAKAHNEMVKRKFDPLLDPMKDAIDTQLQTIASYVHVLRSAGEEAKAKELDSRADKLVEHRDGGHLLPDSPHR